MVSEGKVAKLVGNTLIQLPGNLNTFPSTQGGDQPQHGGSSHTGHRGAKGQPQPLNGCGQPGPHGLQLGRAFQRQHGTIQSHHHTDERAEQTQHHQQPNQIRREDRSRQRDTLPFYSQAHRVLQCNGQFQQPLIKAIQLRWHVPQRRIQPCGSLPILQHLKTTNAIDQPDQHGHGQCQYISADKAGGNPQNRQGTQQECQAK